MHYMRDINEDKWFCEEARKQRQTRIMNTKQKRLRNAARRVFFRAPTQECVGVAGDESAVCRGRRKNERLRQSVKVGCGVGGVE